MEIRFELLKLVHRVGLAPKEVIEHVRQYEKFLDEAKSAAPKKAAGSSPKRGEQP